MNKNKLNSFLVKFAILFSLLVIFAVLFSSYSSQPAAANETEDSFIYLPAIYKPYTTFTPVPLDVNFSKVTDINNAGDDRLFIGERAGLIWVMQASGEKSMFLDIRDRVTDQGSEQGLFSIAFHPNYETNGYFFVSYTTPTSDESAGKLIVSRFQVSSNPNIADPATETIVFSKTQTFVIHNGGGLRFHPNGHLYFGVGDNSNSGAAQSSSDVRGKILRIEVDNMTTNRINMFNAEVSAPTAIVAKGLRNPWRIGIDPVSGELFIGDVGDRQYEEINIMNVNWDGWNFGWPCYEGPSKELECGHSFDAPIFYYPHGLGEPFQGCVVTAGEMNNSDTYFTEGSQFIFADACQRDFYAIYRESGGWQVKHLGRLEGENGLLTAIGKDAEGNLFAGILDDNTSLYKLVIP